MHTLDFCTPWTPPIQGFLDDENNNDTYVGVSISSPSLRPQPLHFVEDLLRHEMDFPPLKIRGGQTCNNERAKWFGLFFLFSKKKPQF